MITTNYAMNSINMNHNRHIAFKENVYDRMGKLCEERQKEQIQTAQKIQRKDNFIKKHKIPIVAFLMLLSCALGFLAAPLCMTIENKRFHDLKEKIDSKKGELDSLNKVATAKYNEIDSLNNAAAELNFANKTKLSDKKYASRALNTDVYALLSKDAAEKMLKDFYNANNYRPLWRKKLIYTNGENIALGQTVALTQNENVCRNLDGTYKVNYDTFLYDEQGNRLSEMDIRKLYRANLLHSLQNIDSLKFENPELFAAVLTSLDVFDVEHDEINKRLCCKKKDGSGLRISYDLKDGKMSGTIQTFKTLTQAKYSEQAPQSSQNFVYTAVNNFDEPSAIFTITTTNKGNETKNENIYVISNGITYKNDEIFINLIK